MSNRPATLTIRGTSSKVSPYRKTAAAPAFQKMVIPLSMSENRLRQASSPKLGAQGVVGAMGAEPAAPAVREVYSQTQDVN